MCIPLCASLIIPGILLALASAVFGAYAYMKKRKDKQFKMYILLSILFFIIGLFMYMGCEPIEWANCTFYNICYLCA